MKNRTKIIIGIVILILILSLAFFYMKSKKDSEETEEKSVESVNGSEIDYLLDTYPLKEVPLYKITRVESSHYHINFDPENTSYFENTNFIYYNVVFLTDATQEELLDYYTELFDKQYDEDYRPSGMVKGYIGKYRVSATHYAVDEYDNTAYVQVYLPNDEFTKENKYFDTFPELFEEDSMFVEHDNSYGLLNQLGGQTEYTKYYTVIDSGDQDDDGEDDVDEFGVLMSKYVALYEEKPNYALEGHLMSWEEDGYLVKVSFNRDHGRVYLNIRGSIE